MGHVVPVVFNNQEFRIGIPVLSITTIIILSFVIFIRNIVSYCNKTTGIDRPVEQPVGWGHSIRCQSFVCDRPCHGKVRGLVEPTGSCRDQPCPFIFCSTGDYLVLMVYLY